MNSQTDNSCSWFSALAALVVGFVVWSGCFGVLVSQSTSRGRCCTFSQCSSPCEAGSTKTFLSLSTPSCMLHSALLRSWEFWVVSKPVAPGHRWPFMNSCWRGNNLGPNSDQFLCWKGDWYHRKGLESVKEEQRQI